MQQRSCHECKLHKRGTHTNCQSEMSESSSSLASKLCLRWTIEHIVLSLPLVLPHVTSPSSFYFPKVSLFLATTQESYACGNMTVRVGYDLTGDFITSDILSDYSLCCLWCQNYTGCNAYTWGLPTAPGRLPNNCWLKHVVPDPIQSEGLLSAYY
jgi:hypothetical protein